MVPDGLGPVTDALQVRRHINRVSVDAAFFKELSPWENMVYASRLYGHGVGTHHSSEAHDLDTIRCIGTSKRELIDRLAGPNVLLNLSYSIHPPLLLQFERRLFCDLDPS